MVGFADFVSIPIPSNVALVDFTYLAPSLYVTTVNNLALVGFADLVTKFI